MFALSFFCRPGLQDLVDLFENGELAEQLMRGVAQQVRIKGGGIMHNNRRRGGA